MHAYFNKFISPIFFIFTYSTDNIECYMKKTNLLFFFFFFCLLTQAAIVDTVYVHSKSMNKDIQVVVVASEKKAEAARTIYLLHGYSGDAKTWIGIKPNLPEIADRHNLLFVCPDGKNSWYWDSPKDPAFRYETFVSKELVDYIDTNYPTLKKKEGRAITGLSMGGHGGLWLGIRHQDVFGAAGSTSGGVDIRPFPKNWEMSKQLGNMENNKDLWNSHTVITQLEKLRNSDLALIFDCGYDDFFFEVNNTLHKRLLELKIEHDYLVRPGGHNNDYWRNSMDYQILFFVKYFNRVSSK